MNNINVNATICQKYISSLVSMIIIVLMALYPLQPYAVELEIAGLITNRTITPVGHDFYRLFSEKWQASDHINLTIYEKPSARWGSIITIKNEQNTLFRTVLFPSKKSLDKSVNQAVNITADNLAKIMFDKALLNTDELAPDEF
ncbi:MAG: curli production assembly/transport protein CsgE [Plesiomonas sp.]|uniref:curli production assembly/transport protein CsgE n=1 Tax=Plesiomonas sp. TaxID=2486279 RepID=UPI003F3553CD